MILDSERLELAQEIEAILADVPAEYEGQVKPELMQSVLEIATKPCEDVAAAGRELAQLRRCVGEVTGKMGLCVAASCTHPSAHCYVHNFVERPRYEELAE